MRSCLRRTVRVLTPAILGAWLCIPIQAQPTGSETVIDRDTTLSTDLVVADNTTLTVKPGVRIEFSSYSKLIVKGLLIVQGTAESPVMITCSNRARGADDRPCWHGLYIQGPQGHAMISYCRIEGAYKNIVYESRPVIENCEFVGNHYGLYCLKKASPHVKNCKFYRNVYGIVSDFSSPLLMDNTITDNTVGLFFQLSAQAVAGKNVIENNRTNVRTESGLGQTVDPLSLQYLWDVMREVY